MSHGREIEQEIEALEQEPAAGDEGALGELMQAGEADAVQSRLESDAVAAARAALQAAEAALEEAEHAAPEPVRADPPLPQRRLWALRAVIVINFALMGIMIALPDRASRPAPAPAVEPQPEAVSPFVQPRRDVRLEIPQDERYDAALLAGRDGDYERAAELMHSYVESHPSLHPSLQQNAYLLLGRYLRLSGRVDDAVEFETLAQRMIGVAHLPEDLWRTARAAEQRGDVHEMRRAYARILLQRGMLTPSQLAVVSEAYLKLGDSYRLEADQGAQRERGEEEKR